MKILPPAWWTASVTFFQPATCAADFQNLNVRLLVHTQHHRILRRVQVQSHHIRRLRGKLRVGGDAPAPSSLQLDFVLAQHAPDLIIADILQGARQQRPRPLAVPWRGRLIQLCQNALLGLLTVAGRLACARPVPQPREAVRQEALPPLRNPRRPGMQLPSNEASPQPIAGQQHDTGTLYQAMLPRTGATPLQQRFSFSSG